MGGSEKAKNALRTGEKTVEAATRRSQPDRLAASVPISPAEPGPEKRHDGHAGGDFGLDGD